MLPAGVIGLGTPVELEQEGLGAGEGGLCRGKSVSKGTDIGKQEMERESCFCSRGSCKQPGKVLSGWSGACGQENGRRGDHFRDFEPGRDRVWRRGHVWRLFSRRGNGGEREDKS